MQFTYDIMSFTWNKEKNTFYADAPFLFAVLPDGSMHPDPFPSEKKQFIIKNYNTNNFRRFTFSKELTTTIDNTEDVDSISTFSITDWLFESEDGIRCIICMP